MPKFNVYRIPKENEKELRKAFKRNKLMLESSRTLKNFNIEFYLDFDKKEIWWINFYSAWISKERKKSKEEDLQNINYFGAIIVSNKSICYVISLGKTHFLIKGYCEFDFGIKFAQKAMDKNNVTLINANSFGGNKRKSLNSFLANTTLEPESGEAITNIKGGSVNEVVLGKNIGCGDSITLSIEECTPQDIPPLISEIEKIIKSKSLFEIPVSRRIVDDKEIQKLDKELVNKILNHPKEVTTVEFIPSDSFGLLFRGDYYIKHFTYKRKKIEVQDNFSIAGILDKIKERGITTEEESILSINVKVETPTGQEILKPLKLFIEYVNDKKYHLHEGRWYQFNKKYLEQLDSSIALIKCERKKQFEDSKKEHSDWLSANKKKKEEWYFERYFNEHIITKEGFINGDRDVVLSEDDEFRRYKLEIADSIKGDMLAFVKKGSLQKLNYVIDQSLASFKYLQENNWKVKIKGKERKISKMCLVLLFERNPFTELTETKSLIFKIKLNEWRKRLIGSNIEPIIWASFIPSKKKKK